MRFLILTISMSNPTQNTGVAVLVMIVLFSLTLEKVLLMGGAFQFGGKNVGKYGKK
jgi:hypothetical protein